MTAVANDLAAPRSRVLTAIVGAGHVLLVGLTIAAWARALLGRA